MTPGEWIALGSLGVALLGAVMALASRVVKLEVKVAAMPSALKTERRLTRIETVLQGIAHAVGAPGGESLSQDIDDE